MARQVRALTQGISPNPESDLKPKTGLKSPKIKLNLKMCRDLEGYNIACYFRKIFLIT